MLQSTKGRVYDQTGWISEKPKLRVTSNKYNVSSISPTFARPKYHSKIKTLLPQSKLVL